MVNGYILNNLTVISQIIIGRYIVLKNKNMFIALLYDILNNM